MKFYDVYYDNKKYKVYNNANFSIIVDRFCNANCKFCVENMNNEMSNITEVNSTDYLKNIHKALNFMRPLDVSISLTGGEPTCSNKLIQLLDIINMYNFRKKVITTNGTHLNSANFKILDKLIDSKFNHLNISKAHYNEKKNQEIMQFKDGKYFTNEQLKQTVDHIKERNSDLRIRMSCIIAKGGIEDINDVINYTEYYKKLGIDNIVFRELMLPSETITNQMIEDFYKNNYVDIDSILGKAQDHSDFKLINETHGYYYDVLVFDYNGMVLCFEKANLANVYAKDKDEIYEFVLLENGDLCGSWDSNDNKFFNIFDE